MRAFDDLVAEAVDADVSGWGFDWLEGRAIEERPPWHYSQLLAERLGLVGSALDIETGGGEVVSEVPRFPTRMVVTESWPPNLESARDLLAPRGVEVVQPLEDGRLPFPDESFELVTSRHPVRPNWQEIYRVLVPGGSYFAEHVGPNSALELIEHFLDPRTDEPSPWEPEREVAMVRQGGLVMTDVRSARCKMEFYDVGAIVWILRKCVWWVPDFSVQKYRSNLVRLDTQIRDGNPVVAHSTRHLIEAWRPM